MAGSIQRVMVVLQATRHPEVHPHGHARLIRKNKQVLAHTPGTREGYAAQGFGQDNGIGRQEFGILYVDGFDGLVQAGGFQVLAVAFDFG